MSERARRILIVDDDPDFSESTAAFLRARRYEVEQAYSGYDGLRRARLDPPDLILMDIMMEERTAGFFTVQQLRRERDLRDLPVVVVSAVYADAPELDLRPERAWMAHDAFLTKPLDLDRLVEEVERLLAAAADPAGWGSS